MIRQIGILAILLNLSSCVAWAKQAPVLTFEVEQFQVEGELPITEAELLAVLEPYKGQHAGLEGLLAARSALSQFLVSEGYSFHRVVLPPQDMANKTVRFKLLEFALGKVEIGGNQHFSADNIRRSLQQLTEGEAPNTQELARNIAHANQHPFKDLALSFKQSQTPNQIDARVKVKDQRPWVLFASANNSGTEQSGESRVSLGAQHTNVWDKDHRLTFTYSTSPENANNIAQYGMNYQIPLYSLSADWSLYYSESEVEQGTVNDIFEVAGQGQVAGTRFVRALPKRKRYEHGYSLAFDDKFFGNDITFADVPLGTDVRSTPLSVGYNAKYRLKKWRFTGDASYAANLQSGADNNDDTYAAVRVGASADWDHWRFGASVNYAFKNKWLYRGVMKAQVTDQALIPGEQFGMGGMNSLRGYQEREVLGDSGVYLLSEFISPALSSLANTRGVVFYDWGQTDRRQAQAGESSREHPESIGAGLRWTYEKNVSLKIDYGHVLKDAASSQAGDSKWHLSLFARF